MRRFVQFTQDLIQNRYSNLLQRIAQEKIPCALFTPFMQIETRDSIIASIQNLQIDLKAIVSYSDAETQNLPNDIESINLNDVDKLYPRPRYIFVFEGNLSGFISGYREKFMKLGIEILVLTPTPNESENYFEIFSKHLTDLFEVYQSLIDDRSRETVLGYVLARISQNMSYLKFDNAPQYFTHGFMPRAEDVVIDAGAYDGVSATLFAEHRCKVIAFEMDARNFSMCQRVSSEKNFVVENFGLGSYSREVSYHSEFASSFVEKDRVENSPTAQIISLDEYVAEKNLPRVDFIKMDIEGSELNALKGAAQTLLRFKPKLAISAYHKPDDLWVLTRFIRSIRPDYEFAIRQYPIDVVSGKNVIRSSPELMRFYESGDVYPHAISCNECVIHAR